MWLSTCLHFVLHAQGVKAICHVGCQLVHCEAFSMLVLWDLSLFRHLFMPPALDCTICSCYVDHCKQRNAFVCWNNAFKCNTQPSVTSPVKDSMCAAAVDAQPHCTRQHVLPIVDTQLHCVCTAASRNALLHKKCNNAAGMLNYNRCKWVICQSNAVPSRPKHDRQLACHHHLQTEVCQQCWWVVQLNQHAHRI